MERKKCDWGFLVCNEDFLILVELKGEDLIHGVRQILSTISIMHTEIEKLNVSARIVLSKFNVPNIENKPDVLKLKKILKHKNVDLKHKTRMFSEYC